MKTHRKRTCISFAAITVTLRFAPEEIGDASRSFTDRNVLLQRDGVAKIRI